MRRSLGLALLLLVAFAGSLAAQPPPMVVKRFVGTARSGADMFEAAYIPLRLLTPSSYSTLTVAEQQDVPAAMYDAFWAFVSAEAASNKPATCVPSVRGDIAETHLDSAPEGSISLSDLATSMPVVVIGNRIYEEPVWNVRNNRVASLSYVKVTQVVKNHSGAPLAANDVLTFLNSYGSVKISGRTFCSSVPPRSNDVPTTGTPAGESKKFLLMGYLDEAQNRFLITDEDYLYRIEGASIYPPVGVPALQSEPSSLTEFLDVFQNQS